MNIIKTKQNPQIKKIVKIKIINRYKNIYIYINKVKFCNAGNLSTVRHVPRIKKTSGNRRVFLLASSNAARRNLTVLEHPQRKSPFLKLCADFHSRESLRGRSCISIFEHYVFLSDCVRAFRMLVFFMKTRGSLVHSTSRFFF